MLNAQSFMLLWKRLVAALSLVAAAALTPTVSAPVGGAGGMGSRVGNGAAFAHAANALIADVEGLVEGGQQEFPVTGPDDTQAKACRSSKTLVQWAPRLQVRSAVCGSPARRSSHAARSGLTRAPPLG